MTIQNFANFVDETIVKKAEKLFKAEKVTDLVEAQEGLWVATVSDQEAHEVEVLLHKNTVKEFSCDCEEANGKICKHVVAVYQAIDAKKQQGVVKRTKRFTFTDLLQNISHNELLSFLNDYAAQNKIFKSDFELYFTDKNSNTDFETKFNEIVQKNLKAGANLNNAKELAKEYKKYIKMGETFTGEANFRDAVVVFKTLFIKLFETYCTKGLNATLLKYLDKIAEHIHFLADYDKVTPQLREQLFSFYGEQMLGKDLIHTDFFEGFITHYEKLALKLQKTNEYLAFLDKKLSEEKIRNGYVATEIKILILKKVEVLLKHLNKKTEADKVVNKYLQIGEVRELRVGEYIAEKNYEAASVLLEEGIAYEQKQGYQMNYRRVKHWEKILMDLAERQNDLPRIRFYAEKRAFELIEAVVDEIVPTTEEADKYYQKWKLTYSTEEWQKVITKEIKELEQKYHSEMKKMRRWGGSAIEIPLTLYRLALIYGNENMTEKLWNLIKDTDNRVITLYLPFLKDYKEEQDVITRTAYFIEAYVNSSYATASTYPRVCNTFQKMVNTFTKSASQELLKKILQKFRKEFNRRTSLLQLLDKIEFVANK